MGNIKFRFKSCNVVDNISFDGEFILVSEIKRWIANKFFLDGDSIKQLTLIDQENRSLKDESYKIISNTEVTVLRTQNHTNSTSERTFRNFEFPDNDLDPYNKFEKILEKDPLAQPATLSLITQQEELLLQQRLFSSVSSLYFKVKPNREKTCRYCKKIGHITRNCLKVSVIQIVRVARGVPNSKFVHKDEGLLYNNQGYFGEIIANEDAFVKDFKNRFGDNTKNINKKKYFNNIQSIKSCKKKDLTTLNSKTMYDTSKSEITQVFSEKQNKQGCFIDSAPVINASLKCTCLFCGEVTHIWQKCPFRMAQLGDVSNVGTYKKNSIDERNLFRKMLFFPPMLLQFMPKGENNLVIYAFGMKKLFDIKDFFLFKRRSQISIYVETNFV
jgi:hypothetical protein